MMYADKSLTIATNNSASNPAIRQSAEVKAILAFWRAKSSAANKQRCDSGPSVAEVVKSRDALLTGATERTLPDGSIERAGLTPDGQPFAYRTFTAEYHRLREVREWTEVLAYSEACVADLSEPFAFCGTCDGAEAKSCWSCRGRKQADCHAQHRADGKIPCHGGKRTRVCGGLKCRHCDHSGASECGLCHGSLKIPCVTCSATGELPCEPCHGTGMPFVELDKAYGRLHDARAQLARFAGAPLTFEEDSGYAVKWREVRALSDDGKAWFKRQGKRPKTQNKSLVPSMSPEVAAQAAHDDWQRRRAHLNAQIGKPTSSGGLTTPVADTSYVTTPAEPSRIAAFRPIGEPPNAAIASGTTSGTTDGQVAVQPPESPATGTSLHPAGLPVNDSDAGTWEDFIARAA